MIDFSSMSHRTLNCRPRSGCWRKSLVTSRRHGGLRQRSLWSGSMANILRRLVQATGQTGVPNYSGDARGQDVENTERGSTGCGISEILDARQLSAGCQKRPRDACR